MNQISWHGYQTANRKDHNLSAIFLIYSNFSNRNQASLFSPKLMISWLQWLEKKVGCPCSLVSYIHFSTDRAQYQGNPAIVLMCALNDAIKYAQRGCAMQLWGITLIR